MSGPQSMVTRGFFSGSLAQLLVLLALWAGAWLSSPAFAAVPDPSGVSVTLEGCRNTGSITLPIGGRYVCPDAAYTSGNLGKGWSELDLVPHRLTLSAGNSAPLNQTYALAISADNCIKTGTVTGFKCVTNANGVPGYDVMSSDAANGFPVLNTALSSASCTALSSTAQLTKDPGVGGTDVSIYRILTVSQGRNSTCVYDYYERLALGARQYSGSSLHSNALNQNLGTAGIGARDVSIPVKEIAPQVISKTMSASQSADVVWGVSKTGPTSVNFGDVCAAGGPQPQGAKITVTWTKLATTGGGVTVQAIISATNPAARSITVSVTDEVHLGPSDPTLQGAIIHTAGPFTKSVPANTTMVVGTDTFTLASGATVGQMLSDIATATYTDDATGIAVPGKTTATAETIIQQGSTSNSTATITDSESITGNGLTFSVASPSPGSFTGGYIANTDTVGPVDWIAQSQADGGSVTFDKLVKLDGPRVTSGTLSDTAKLVASDGFETSTDPFEISITSDAAVALTVEKSIPSDVVFQAGDKLDVAFKVTRLGDSTFLKEFVLTFTSVGTLSKTISGLAPDTYFVTEGVATFLPGGDPTKAKVINLVPLEDNPQTADLTVQKGEGEAYANCAATLTFTNVPGTGAATAKVQKITEPELPSNDPDYTWTFRLSGPAQGLPEDQTVGAGAGYVDFVTPLVTGNYTVTEQLRSGWYRDGVINPNGSTSTTTCTFSVNILFDAGHSFGCTFKNVKFAKAKVVKTVSGRAPRTGESYTFQLRSGASASAAGSILETKAADASNGGVINFAYNLVPGTYQLCEVIALPAWMTTLGPPLYSVFNPSGDNSTVCTDFTVAAGDVASFDIVNTPPPGGLALTIGYWKNHAACKTSKGGQMDALGKVLAKGAITIGIEVVDTCPEAVALLNKQTYSGGKKVASDPAFNVAAQLLAARLNVQAGAGACVDATSAMTTTQTLLAALKFDGNTHTAISASDALTLNTQNAILDDYNNNRLCGP